MNDMEKLYIKEKNEISKRGRSNKENEKYKSNRSCRSNSLKNRKLIISKNSVNHKHEWIVLP